MNNIKVLLFNIIIMARVGIKINKWDTFNNLTIIKEIKNIIKTRNRIVLCKCVCWKEVMIQLSHLRSWSTKWCWCLRWKWNLKHWLYKNKLHYIWVNMRARCNNENHQSYKDYGGRWIKVSKEWDNFKTFYDDMNKKHKDWLQIERINNDLWYNKDNCKWATRKEQARNRRSTKIYKWKCYTEWAEELWVNRSTIPRWIKANKI